LAQRRRKRGRREKRSASRAGTATQPASPAAPPARATRRSRSEEKDAAVRATLTPFRPGDRPWPITVGAVLAAANGVAQLVLFIVGVKLKVAGKHPAPVSTVIFAVLMFVCAGGMWKMRYWAVLGFQALLAIVILSFALVLVRANNFVGFAVSAAVVAAGGFLFYKLVKVLSRIQMPKYPGR